MCVINLKGGVGKSTITALLSRYAFNTRKKNVLAIDLDPQANLSQGLMHQSYTAFIKGNGGSIVEVFADYMPPAKGGGGAQPLSTDHVTQMILESGDRRLDLIPSRFDFSDALTNAIRPDPRILARFLAKNYKEKDLILIDCSPTESVFTTAAYHASDYVLIPVKPEFFATIGFPLLAESLSNFRRRNKAHSIEVAGVIINNAFYDGGNDGGPEKQRAMEAIAIECKKNDWYIFPRQMYHSRGYPKLMRGDYSHQGDAAYFPSLAKDLLDHLGV
ncbi:ParA family protein [Endobacter medicaginis]